MCLIWHTLDTLAMPSNYYIKNRDKILARQKKRRAIEKEKREKNKPPPKAKATLQFTITRGHYVVEF